MRKSLSLVASVGLVTLLYGASSASAQAVAPALGSESTFGVVSNTFTNSNTAPQTIINGNVCFTTGSAAVPLTVNGTYGACPAAAGTDQLGALGTLNGQGCTSLGAIVALETAPGHPTGVYTPGCYSSTGAMSVNTTVTLNGAGVYVFRSGGAFNTAANSLVTLAGGACESDVFWTAVSATTLGANVALSATPTFVGTIIDQAGITIGHFANLTGRALAFPATVTTDANTISVPTCPAFVGGGGGGGGVPPKVTKAFSPNGNGPGVLSTLTITLTNANATAATLTAALVDTLPTGVVLAASPNASTTCGGTVTAAAGGGSITLSQAGSTIPASGSCTVIANVTSATAGSYTNTIAVGALQTSNGNNTVAGTATLTIAASSPVPTLSQWAMIVLAALLCLGGFLAIRRKRTTD
jgi:hypothetical protein